MTLDAVVVGSGPNGLAAAVTLARAGLRVEVFEAHPTIGGGLRTQALFDSDVRHDICAAVHPMATASPFLAAFDLPARGVELLHSPAAYAHPLPDATAVAYRDLDRTCNELGPDGPRWRALMAPLVARSPQVVELFLDGPRATPGSAGAAVRVATRVLRHGPGLDRSALRTEAAAALLAGVAAHGIGPLPSLPGAGVAVLLGHLAHATGWPLPAGGSDRIADALAADAVAHGAVVHTDHPVNDLAELPESRAVLLDLGPREFVRIAGDRLPRRYRAKLDRFRYGPGAAKVDLLLSGPVPWTDPRTALAATVHLGGTRAEVHQRETTTARGHDPDLPFVLLVDPVTADPGRAAGTRRPLWAYAHVPNGSTADPYEIVRRAVEPYAPGFRDLVTQHRSITAADYEQYNPNYVGGDIAGGAMTLRQSLARPVAQRDPYRTPLPGVYLCSASTPPGPGVHGMCGLRAARSALRREFGLHEPIHLGPDTDTREPAPGRTRG